ncbi:MAG: cyclase family protein [Actinobacteria bacterium]|nr:cyclase family protein [Actinomycetota bacterium]
MPDLIEAGGQRMVAYDLSATLTNETSSFEANPHHIEYTTNEDMEGICGDIFEGLTVDYFPDGKLFNIETVTLSTHAGTHVDAPHHYGPARAGVAQTIDEVSLRWYFGDGVRLDFTHKEPGSGITKDDVLRALDAAGHELKPYDIVLAWTGTSAHYGEPGYERIHPGLRREATEFLIDQGVRLIGIDAWGLDRPNHIMIEEARAGDRDQLLESHVLGREKAYSQIEKLANLDQLPVSTGFTVAAFPIKLERASGAWARVVAFVPEAG